MRASIITGYILFLFTSFSVFAQVDTVILSYAPFNSDGNEYAVRKFQDGLIFVGVAKDSNGNEIRDKKTGETFTDLYSYKNGTISNFEIPNASGVVLNASSYFFDGPCSSSEDGEILFFSNNNLGPKDKQTLGVFYTIKEGKGYARPLPLPFNSVEYNTTHPFYDNDTKYLYFSSDMITGMGGMDIYRVKFENNVFGELETLDFNSDKNDLFPYVQKGIVYITSNRDGGLGGYDLYIYQNAILNKLNSPFNSVYDDLAISFITDSEGYFSSNRPSIDLNSDKLKSSLVQDDVFAFEVKRIKSVITIDLQLSDNNGDILKNAVLTLRDLKTDELKFKGVSDNLGLVKGVVDTLELNNNVSYKINIIKEGYVSPEKVIKINTNKSESFINNTVFETNIKAMSDGLEISDILELKEIYYDFNSSILRTESIVELDKIIHFMNSHPEVSLELGSHTDCKGSEEYNDWLSEKRASVAKEYIAKRLTLSKSITAIGYGEKKPKVKCNCESIHNGCSDSEYQLNRRTEFKIVSTKNILKDN